MGGYVIVSEIGSQITFIRDNLPIKKSDLLLKKPIPIFYMIVIWLEKVWLVDKSAQEWPAAAVIVQVKGLERAPTFLLGNTLEKQADCMMI